MKPKASLRSFIALAGSSLLAVSSASAGQIWDGGSSGPGDNNWNTAANWDGDILPTFTNAITFMGNTRNGAVNNLAADSTIGGIDLTNDGSSGKTSAFTLSGARITLGGNINTTANTAGSTITDTISLNMILNGDRTITTNQQSSTVQHNLTISGIISQDVSNRTLIKQGGGRLSLTVANSYAGGTTISAGNIRVTHSSALGSGSVSVASGGVLFLDTNGLTVANDIELNGISADAAINNNAPSGGNVTNLTGKITLNTTSNITTHWNDKTLQLSGKITGAGGLNLDLNTRSGAVGGRYLITGATNDYEGATSITGTATPNFGFTGQAMLYLGATNALPATTALTLNYADLYLNGQSQTLSSISGSGSFAVQNGSNTAATLTLGSGDTSSTFSGTIKDNGLSVTNTTSTSPTPPPLVTGTVALTKIGSGALTLTNSNTYSGTTAINGGTLVITGATQATSAITFSGGGKLGLDISSPVAAASATINFTGQTVLVSGSPTLASYTLLTANSITGTPTLAAPAPAGYELKVESSNTLKLVKLGYASWAALNGAGPNLSDDHDNDGVNNGVEYFLGGPNGPTTGFTAVPGVVNNLGTLSVTWIKGAGYIGAYNTHFVVETSTTLSGPWTVEASPGNVTDSPTSVIYMFPGGPAYSGKRFARLKVTGP